MGNDLNQRKTTRPASDVDTESQPHPTERPAGWRSIAESSLRVLVIVDYDFVQPNAGAARASCRARREATHAVTDHASSLILTR